MRGGVSWTRAGVFWTECERSPFSGEGGGYLSFFLSSFPSVIDGGEG